MTETLKEYQEIDGQIKKIIDGINRSEEAKASKRIEQFLKDAEENLKKMEQRARELSAAYVKLREKFNETAGVIGDLDDGVENAIDSGELNYISKKLNEAGKNAAIAERETLAIVREMEEMMSKYDSLRGKVPSAQKQYGEVRNVVNNMKREKEAEVTALKKQREELGKKLEPQILEIYQRLRSQNLFPPCVTLDAGRCGGCRMDIPSGVAAKLNTETHIICENCGRIVTR